MERGGRKWRRMGKKGLNIDGGKMEWKWKKDDLGKAVGKRGEGRIIRRIG